MQLRTHISRRSHDSRQTLVISTVPLGVVTSKTLLALWETGVSNVAGFGFAYTAKRREGFLRLGHTLEYLAFFDVARNKRQAPRVPSDVRTFRKPVSTKIYSCFRVLVDFVIQLVVMQQDCSSNIFFHVVLVYSR